MRHLGDKGAAWVVHVVFHQWEARLAVHVMLGVFDRLRIGHKALTWLLLCAEQLELPGGFIGEGRHRVHVFCQIGRRHLLFLRLGDGIVEACLLIALEFLHAI